MAPNDEPQGERGNISLQTEDLGEDPEALNKEDRGGENSH